MDETPTGFSCTCTPQFTGTTCTEGNDICTRATHIRAFATNHHWLAIPSSGLNIVVALVALVVESVKFIQMYVRQRVVVVVICTVAI